MTEPLNSDAIQTLLPHRFPMLLVDKVLELEPGKRALGVKNVTINEPFLVGHFPGMAVMPGVLLIEAMAQVAGIMMLTCPDYAGKIPFIAEVESARFYRPVVPGDTLVIETISLWTRGLIGKMTMNARVDGALVVKCEMKFALKEKPDSRNEQLERLGLGPVSDSRENEPNG